MHKFKSKTSKQEIKTDCLILLFRWNATQSRVQLKMFPCGKFVVKCIELGTIADVLLNSINIFQNAVTDNNYSMLSNQ